METMRRAIEGGSKVPYEVSRVVFRGTLALEGWARRIEHDAVTIQVA
jgi:hypothetical protein